MPTHNQSAIERLPWPLITLDIEASSLACGTYPIEVGICRWQDPNAAIEGWSTLIQPLPSWLEQGSWSPASAEIHGIRPEELNTGRTCADALTALNAIIGSQRAFCDGGASDLAWLSMIISGAGLAATFHLSDFDALTGALDQSGYHRFMRWSERAPPLHRARDDAERLMLGLANGLGLEQWASKTIVLDV